MEQTVPVLPEIDNEAPVADMGEFPPFEPAKKISPDELYYAAASYSEDPVKDYQEAIKESAGGSSTLLKMAEEKWLKEQDDAAKVTLIGMMEDPSYDNGYKRAALQTYLTGGFIGRPLRDKYLGKIAAVDPAITELDRVAQDIYINGLQQRDQARIAKEKEAQAEKGKSKVVATAKAYGQGTASVASSMLAAIPAGLFGIVSLIDEKDGSLATKVIEEVIKDFSYMPAEEASQQAADRIAKVLEYLDIPFQWLGDQTLELTGSPGAATAVYTGSSMAGYYGIARGTAKVIGVGKPKISPTSPAGTTATANPKVQGDLAAQALADPTGQLSAAMRAEADQIIAQQVLPRVQDEFGTIYPDLRERLEKMDKNLEQVYEETNVNAFLLPKSIIEEDLLKFKTILKEESGPYWQQANSLVKYTDEGISGKALFGRNSDFGYTTDIAANTALASLKAKIDALPADRRGVLSVEKIEDQYYVQWQFAAKENPFFKLAMGDDALNARFFGVDVTNFANSWVGKQFWPSYMRMKSNIPASGALAGLSVSRLEDAYLRQHRDTIGASKHPTELNQLLRKGEEEGVEYNLNDITRMYPDMSKADRGRLAFEYKAVRQLTDHLWKLSDRHMMRQLERENMQVLYDRDGTKLGFASSRIPVNEPIKKVWDFETKSVRETTPEMTGFVKLRTPMRVGDEILDYGRIVGQTLRDPHPGVLTRIPGYIPRENKMEWVVEATPKQLFKDGTKIPDSELRNYKSVVGGDRKRSKADALAARLAVEYPNATLSVRRDRQLIEDAVVLDSHVYDMYFAQGHKRGERLKSLDGYTELEDVGVSLSKAVKLTSRVVGWDSTLASLKKNWVDSYGEFTKHEFPNQVTDIVPHKVMSIEESARHRTAVEIYNQIRFQTRSDELPSDRMWKDTFHRLSDVVEDALPQRVLNGIRELAEKGNIPVKAMKAVPRHMWLYLRPGRQWVVQPSQALELLGLKTLKGELGYAKDLQMAMPIFFSLLVRHSPEYLKYFKPVADFMSDAEVKKVTEAFYTSGIMQSVDTNALLHGLFRDPDSPLVKGGGEKLLEVTKEGIQLPSKIGRKIGYDSAELLNQVTVWLYARRKWIDNNPGKDWSKEENVKAMTGTAWAIGHGAFGRAGMMPWQEGVLGTFLQFAAIPHKGLMQMFSAKELSGSDKAALAASRAFWYGVYGIPLYAGIDWLINQYLTGEQFDEFRGDYEKWKSGVADAAFNGIINTLSDDEVETNLDLAKSVTVVPPTVFFWDFSKAIFDLTFNTDYSEDVKFPFQTGYVALFDSTKILWDVFSTPSHDVNSEQFMKAMNLGLGTLSAGWNDYLIAEQIETYRDRIDKGGGKAGLQLSLAEAEARLFMGVPSKKERLLYEARTDAFKRNKAIREGGQKIWKDMYDMRGILGTPDFEQKMEQLNHQLQGFDSSLRAELIQAFFKVDREKFLDKKGSVLISYSQALSKDKYLQDMEIKLRAMNDPKANEFLDVFKKGWQ